MIRCSNIILFYIQVNVAYNNDVPIPQTLGRSCDISNVGPISAGNVTFVEFDVRQTTESYLTRMRIVLVSLNVTWMTPTSGGEGITDYDIRLGTDVRNDTSFDDGAVRQPVADGLSLETAFTIRNAPAGVLTLFLQVGECVNVMQCCADIVIGA